MTRIHIFSDLQQVLATAARLEGIAHTVGNRGASEALLEIIGRIHQIVAENRDDLLLAIVEELSVIEDGLNDDAP